MGSWWKFILIVAIKKDPILMEDPFETLFLTTRFIIKTKKGFSTSRRNIKRSKFSQKYKFKLLFWSKKKIVENLKTFFYNFQFVFTEIFHYKFYFNQGDFLVFEFFSKKKSKKLHNSMLLTKIFMWGTKKNKYRWTSLDSRDRDSKNRLAYNKFAYKKTKDDC